MRRHYLLGLLLLSGAAGLAYELLWVRLLALTMGTTTLSFATVLAVFFGGLAVGSRWAGKRLPGTTRPIRAYALLEAATGALGLLLYPVMRSMGPLFAAVDPGPGLGGVAARLVVAVLLLLPPTFLMGATLPFACLATIERDEEAGSGTALVYGFNTLGACLGAYGLTFWLLPNLGVFASVLTVAMLNFTVAAVALLVSRRPGGDGPVSAAPPTPVPGAPATAGAPLKRVQLALIATFVGGLVATGAQIVWTRYFSIALKGTAFGLGAVLVSVLVGIALGSLLAGWLARRVRHLVAAFGAIQLVLLAGLASFGPLAPLFTYFNGTLQLAGWSFSGELHGSLVLVWLVLALPTVASGASLPLLVALIQSSARDAGSALSRLYAANTAGCILGSVTVGFFLLPTLGTNQTLYLLALLLTLVLAAVVLVLGRDTLARSGLITAAALLLVWQYPTYDAKLASVLSFSRGDYFQVKARAERLVKDVLFFHEGDVATVTVLNTNEQRGLSLNGLGQGLRLPTVPHVRLESLLVGAMPWVHASRADTGLVIGLGAGGTVNTLLGLGVGSLEVCELEHGVLEAVDTIWLDQSPLSDPRVKVVENDARHHLLVQARRAPHRYDFITSMPSHPWVASGLFTRDFFEIAKQNLAPGGVFSTWFGVGSMSPESVESLFGAFTAVFAHYFVYWVADASAFYLVGANEPLVLDISRLQTAMRSEAFVGHPPALTTPYYLLERLAAVSPESPAPPMAVINTDDNSIIEFGIRSRPPARTPDYVALLPLRTLPASRVRAADVEAVFLELLERTFGTPEGRLPHGRFAKDQARRFVDGLSSSLSQPLRDYASLRMAIADGKRPEAVELAGRLSGGLAERGRLFVAAAAVELAERKKGLEALEPRPASAEAMLVALGDSPAVRAQRPAAADDPLAWLFAEPAQLKALSLAERTELIAPLQQRVLAFSSGKLFAHCAEQAKAAEWGTLRQTCSAGAERSRRAEASDLVRASLSAGEAGRYAEAAKLLTRAQAIEPLATDQVRLLLRTAVRLADPSLIALATEVLRSRGDTAATIESLVASYRRDDAEAQKAPAHEPVAP